MLMMTNRADEIADLVECTSSSSRGFRDRERERKKRGVTTPFTFYVPAKLS